MLLYISDATSLLEIQMKLSIVWLSATALVVIVVLAFSVMSQAGPKSKGSANRRAASDERKTEMVVPQASPLLSSMRISGSAFHPNDGAIGGDLTSPERALEFEFGAMMRKDFREAARGIAFSDKAKPVADEMYAQLPEYIKSKFVSTEEMWMALMSANPKRQGPVSRQQATREVVDTGDVVLSSRIRYADGSELDHIARYRQFPDGSWRNLVRDNYLVSFYTQPEYTANILAKVLNVPPVEVRRDGVLDSISRPQPNTLDDIISTRDRSGDKH